MSFLEDNKIKAFLLVLPLLAFILITFVFPIFDMLARSVDDKQINTVFPKTFEVFKKWDQKDLPSEELYASMFNEIMTAEGYQIGKASTRMNYSKSGWKSLIKKSKRKFKKIKEGPYKDKMTKINSYGSGGLITKLEAAKICMNAGCHMFIANCNKKNPIKHMIQTKILSNNQKKGEFIIQHGC